jgi:hypothetical protein
VRGRPQRHIHGGGEARQRSKQGSGDEGTFFALPRARSAQLRSAACRGGHGRGFGRANLENGMVVVELRTVELVVAVVLGPLLRWRQKGGREEMKARDASWRSRADVQPPHQHMVTRWWA